MQGAIGCGAEATFECCANRDLKESCEKPPQDDIFSTCAVDPPKPAD